MWLNPLETADLVTFAEEILNGKFHFLCSESYCSNMNLLQPINQPIICSYLLLTISFMFV